MNELKPCPFCGADNKPMGNIIKTDRKGVWKHWYTGCILDGFIIKEEKAEAWNRRADNE